MKKILFTAAIALFGFASSSMAENPSVTQPRLTLPTTPTMVLKTQTVKPIHTPMAVCTYPGVLRPNTGYSSHIHGVRPRIAVQQPQRLAIMPRVVEA